MSCSCKAVEREGKKKTHVHMSCSYRAVEREEKKKKQVVCTGAAFGTKKYAGHVHINASNRPVQKNKI
jgi:hypothetical protein